VIKKRHLPECFSGFEAEMECGFVFEGFDKGQEVRRCGIALKQQVQVIGHQAVGAKGEGMLNGSLLERFHEPFRDARRAEIGDAIVGAES